MAANNSEFLMVSTAWGGTSLGIPTGFSYTDMVEHITVSGDGEVGPTARAINSRDARVTLTHLVGAPQAVGTPGTPATPASLVVVQKDMAGTSKTHTWTLMIPGTSVIIGQKNGLMERSQEFIHVGAMATNPYSEA